MFFDGFHGVLCFLLVVLMVLNGVMGAALVFMGSSCRDGCDSGFAGRLVRCPTRHTAAPITHQKTTLRFPKATHEPLRATESRCRATPSH